MAKESSDKYDAEKRKPAASEVFSIRMSAADKDAITQAARAQGLSRNELMKRLARHAVGELTAPDDVIDAWSNALRQLNGACNNLNQMTKVARRGQLAWGDPERADVRAVYQHADEIRRLLAAAVETARAGRALPTRLKRFAEEPNEASMDG